MGNNARCATPLHAACRVDSTGACCHALLEAAADPGSRCLESGTCLHQAGQFLMASAARVVLDVVAKSGHEALRQAVNLGCKNGWTPLHSSVYKPDARLLQVHASPA